jgi:hypothetical protein
VRDGGNVDLICCVGVFANSGIVLAKEMFEMGAVACCAWQDVFSGICSCQKLRKADRVLDLP